MCERADSYPDFKTAFGHQEGDAIVGEKNKSAFITLVERCSTTHDIDIFFVDPGCPGQRGLNEHSNGLLRRNGLPKQLDFANIPKNYLTATADKAIEFLGSL